MSGARPWYEDERFWELRAPFFLGPESWERVPREVDQLLALLQLEAPATVLDLCCGRGRHSLELARRGFEVTAVDRTETYLREAQRRAKGEDLTVEFVLQDMRGFLRPETFQVALNMFSSFGYFEDPEDDRTVLQNLYASLAPGGKLLLDLKGKEILAAGFPRRNWQEREGVLFLSEVAMTGDWSWIRNHETYITATGRYVFDVDHRVYSAAELKSLVTQCGFDQITCYGSLEATPYDERAKRLVLVAVK